MFPLGFISSLPQLAANIQLQHVQSFQLHRLLVQEPQWLAKFSFLFVMIDFFFWPSINNKD
jgi:hypothetical protein